MRYYALALLAALVLVASRVDALGGRIHPDLVEAVERLNRARGPEAYTALRGIWNTWDRTDPTHVEEALLLAHESKKLSPAARAYAGLLTAYARIRRGDLSSARAKIRQLGYVDRWLVVGPFDNEGKSGFSTELGPELELGQPIVPGRVHSGKERPVRWRVAPDVFWYGWLDTGALVRPEENVCVFATTFVSDRREAAHKRPISVWVGSGGAFKLFWNGRAVLEDAAYRRHDADRLAATVELLPGKNNLTLKTCGEESAPVVSVRVADRRGAPDENITFSNALHDSEAAAKNAVDATKKPSADVKESAANAKAKKAGQRGDPSGPLQDFQNAGQDPKKATANTLEAYARYLVVTRGDDPTEHTARNLAQEAAEKEPSVERLLLAASLAEDRNKTRSWIEKAVALADKEEAVDKDVLLAQARLAETGPNYRDAFPYYDRVLELDPDDLRATRRRVELYNEAGLKRTALSILERAVERNPRSIMALNMYATQLRALGRVTEADEVEARYAALRFDDRSYIHGKIELATERKDKSAAEHWLGRLLASDPDSQWALSVAARTHRSFGEPDRAVASLERALELAPEDVGSLRALADLKAELGQPEAQLALLRQVLKIRPQDRETREYLEHIEPPKARPDERYAYEPERFLRLRHAPANGHNRRTLRDLTVTTVYPNGLSSKFRQIVFQPLTDSAAAIARQYGFQYQADRETVQLKGARVFRGDGRVDEAVEYGEGAANDPSMSMYTSARNFYVQLPRLEPGDVVELRYRVDEVTPRNEYADYFGDVVYFGSDEPVANAEYVLITPKSRQLHIDEKVPGLERKVSESGDQRIYRFYAGELAAIAPEPEMPPWPEVLPFVHVSTYESWKDLGRWYWGLAKDQFDLDAETRRLARDISKDASTNVEKVKAVYDWVIRNTRYVALEFGIYGYKPRRCVQTVARGWGDCKDKATVIATLLKELGIDSTIVIVRTQLRGDFISKLPSLAPFDHAIVYVPSLDLYLDGTAEYTGIHELPIMDLGALALQVNEGDAKLVHLPEVDPKKNVVSRKTLARLDADGSATLDVDYVVSGSHAPGWRRRYQADATRRERLSTDLGRDLPGFEIKDGAAGIRAQNLDDFDKPVELGVTGTAPSFARVEGEQLSLQVTPDIRLTPTYASLSQRRRDVRILAFATREDEFRLKLPAGMKIIDTPPVVAHQSRFGLYRVQVEQKPGEVVVRTRLEVHRTRIEPSEYRAWKKFCADADQALGHRLIIGR